MDKRKRKRKNTVSWVLSKLLLCRAVSLVSLPCRQSVSLWEMIRLSGLLFPCVSSRKSRLDKKIDPDPRTRSKEMVDRVQFFFVCFVLFCFVLWTDKQRKKLALREREKHSNQFSVDQEKETSWFTQKIGACARFKNRPNQPTLWCAANVKRSVQKDSWTGATINVHTEKSTINGWTHRVREYAFSVTAKRVCVWGRAGLVEYIMHARKGRHVGHYISLFL